MIEFLTHLRDTFSDHVLFGVGVLLVAGYFFGKLAETVRLPAITGYIFTGLILGDSITGIIHTEMTHTLRTLTEVALGIIAITIGSEFGIGKLRRLGSGMVIITAVQLFATFAAVGAGLLLCGMPLPYALMLGAIATATAPAATVVIIQELKARGDYVDTLYGVVALDDAGCVVLFAAVFAFAGTMIHEPAPPTTASAHQMHAAHVEDRHDPNDTAATQSHHQSPQHAGGAPAESADEAAHAGGGDHASPQHGADHGIGAAMWHGFSEVLYSLILGAAGGAVLHVLTRKAKHGNELLILALGGTLMLTAIALAQNLSPLLPNMMAGAVMINLSSRGNRVFRALTPLTPPLYAAFFAIAGTELVLSVLADPRVLLMGAVFVLFRAAGKYSGVWAGAWMAGSPKTVRDYLGLSMLPQAGVAIALVLLVNASPVVFQGGPAVHEAVGQMTNIVLFAVLINELVGPPLSRYAIIHGAEL